MEWFERIPRTSQLFLNYFATILAIQHISKHLPLPKTNPPTPVLSSQIKLYCYGADYKAFSGANFPNQDLISHIKCALYKSEQWEYEKEWRLIDTTTRNNIILDNTTSILLKPIAIYYGNCTADIHK